MQQWQHGNKIPGCSPVRVYSNATDMDKEKNLPTFIGLMYTGIFRWDTSPTNPYTRSGKGWILAPALSSLRHIALLAPELICVGPAYYQVLNHQTQHFCCSYIELEIHKFHSTVYLISRLISVVHIYNSSALAISHRQYFIWVTSVGWSSLKWEETYRTKSLFHIN